MGGFSSGNHDYKIQSNSVFDTSISTTKYVSSNSLSSSDSTKNATPDTETGTPWSPEIESIDDLSQMNGFPNPNISIRIAYTNRKTDEYEFDISTAINSNTITHEYDSSMKDYIRKQVELRKMIESKSQEMKSVSNIK